MLQQMIRIAVVLAILIFVGMTTMNEASGQTKKFPVVPPNPRRLVKPDCSVGQSCHGIHGVVVVVVDVLTDGTVGDATVTSGDPRLADDARKAAKQCRFSPGTLMGKPTNMNYDLKYEF